MRSQVRTVLIVAVTIALLAFFFRDANFAEVWAETRRARRWVVGRAGGETLISDGCLARLWLCPSAPVRVTGSEWR